MQEPFFIKKIAVLGAGVMGAQIAAHCINAGIETLLFDLAAKEGGLNSLIDQAVKNLTKLKPSPLATPQSASLLKIRNYEENLAELSDCDLIIEAIAERLDWKQDLYQRISPYLGEQSILVTNTSGLSINVLAEALPEKNREHFCGVHFFNPPRYMRLTELIPAKLTSAVLLDALETWLTRYLGKGVVRAKDTPNFIANRVGVFSLLAILHRAQEMSLSLDEVDSLTGVLIGRPKSATFRTMDVVGLDTMEHVVRTMEMQLPADPWHELFKLPEWLMTLIQKGYLGQKSGQGIYRKNGKAIEVYDVELKQYRPVQDKVSDEIKNIMKLPDARERMRTLFTANHPQARFLTACFFDLFHYCTYHLAEIADSVRDVDSALRWGFGWQQGPFEIWQAAGVDMVKGYLEKAIAENRTLSSVKLPAWVLHLDNFYTKKGAFSPVANQYQEQDHLAVYERQFFSENAIKCIHPTNHLLWQNPAVELWHLQDDIAVISFKTKANTIGQEVLDGFNQALDIATAQCQGLIIYQYDANNFSAGADLRGVGALLQANKLQALDEMIAQFQCLAMRIKYSPIPVVAALRGRALGGGCELVMHCAATVAAFESYPGLVEVGAGLIPAGGGCKEMALRAAEEAKEADLFVFLKPYFEQIATGFVAGSATEAAERGYLKPQDVWVMNTNEVLYAALARVKYMQAVNYSPPLPVKFKVAGREGHARLQIGLVNWLEGGFISQHDYFLANHLARVLCGGDLNQGEQVDEAWMLKLEREAFIALAETSLTQARIKYLLETGKPLRN
ncbi:3-hydroxyacyl-CoA dehydrogenase/enoyl-CoA hydratase family protein [Legionella septentrionalis]|uniref:3-hydroxyacyl-CoA dehydrogenase/enoyl-CoA hydratase family protein n=1 Tax=Legionella septentrionalis TaxID=2498109 RepID=UPI000F8EED9E|nr:3-hydroxyacyl-CoA dehydrogenase/enoyl-CoA hydratase family protein [Legionella septentrionalis]RUR14677.1 3-hydroxyacyl-CoA dehydrogenase/enoyl-CoA hydratase family protein [Legionella septentrionalis]